MDARHAAPSVLPAVVIILTVDVLPGFGDPAHGQQAGHHLRYLVAALVQQCDHLLGELRRGLQQPRSLVLRVVSDFTVSG
jgi:hypothetical protein